MKPMRKVPAITAFFWIVKVLTTAAGESASDYLVRAIDPIVAVALGALAFALALSLQFWVRRYNAWIYWFAVAMVAVFGTMAADVLHIGLGIPYLDGTIFFALALGIVFGLWYGIEKTLSIHSITTKRRELFYWLAVVTTFALGTASGDMAASTLGLGYLVSGITFALMIAIIASAHYLQKSIFAAAHIRQSRNAIISFWLAYIVTRPLGASFADWFGKAPSSGGLGWGDGTVTLILAGAIIALVAYLAVTHVDAEKGSVTAA